MKYAVTLLLTITTLLVVSPISAGITAIWTGELRAPWSTRA
jgi:hypothetical protein